MWGWRYSLGALARQGTDLGLPEGGLERRLSGQFERGVDSTGCGGADPASACLQARELLLARGELLALEKVPDQRVKFLLRQSS